MPVDDQYPVLSDIAVLIFVECNVICSVFF